MTTASRRRRSTTRLLAAALAAGAAAVVACGGVATSGGEAVAAAAGVRLTPASAPDADATLRYGAANLVTRFDPHRSSNGYDQNWLAPVYDRLIWQTPEVELEPGLATEWDFVDDTTFEMTLREGVTFHDGEAFDAQAVADNIDRAKNVEGSGVHAYLASVDTVEVVDATHVVFHLNRPDATLPMQLATRPGMMISPAAFENPDLDTNPVGTGPYRLVEYREGDTAVYERNDEYWNPDYAGVARIEITYLPDAQTRLNALRSGQLDATVIDVASIEAAQGTDGLVVEVYDTIETYHFQPDRTKSEFGDPLVRLAMSHAIDREGIVEGLMFGYARPATQWVAEGTPYYVEDLGESTTYDPELARELLAEAGLADGFTFDAMVSVQPVYVRLAEILQGQFAEIGITMNVTQEPNLADAFFVQNAADAIVSPYPGRIDPAETTQVYFNADSFSNPGREVAPEIEEAWLAALIPGDDRPAALQDLLRAIDASMPNIPILYPQVGLAATEQVQGLEWYLSGHIEFAGVTMTG